VISTAKAGAIASSNPWLIKAAASGRNSTNPAPRATNASSAPIAQTITLNSASTALAATQPSIGNPARRTATAPISRLATPRAIAWHVEPNRYPTTAWSAGSGMSRCDSIMPPAMSVRIAPAMRVAPKISRMPACSHSIPVAHPPYAIVGRSEA
jgi:hypothetical protein